MRLSLWVCHFFVNAPLSVPSCWKTQLCVCPANFKAAELERLTVNDKKTGFLENKHISPWLAAGKYENHNLELVELKFLEPCSLLHMKGQGWEADFKNQENIKNEFWLLPSSQIDIKKIYEHKPFVVSQKKAQLILYRGVFCFYFFNVSIAKVYQVWCTFNIEIFCMENCGNCLWWCEERRFLAIHQWPVIGDELKSNSEFLPETEAVTQGVTRVCSH